MIVSVADRAMLSVRGEAQRTVSPDYVTLQSQLTLTAGSKVDALAAVRAAQQRLIGELSGMGGVVLSVESRRTPLTWSMGSTGTHEEHDFDRRTGNHGPTGRLVANGSVVITARDMGLLANLGVALARVEQLHVEYVGWHVDSDNAAWREVRADAIAAAISKARDYAAALGGAVTSVEHVADVGLLTSGAGEIEGRRIAHPVALMASAEGFDGAGDAPSLDPVPQEIHAVVEARLVAEIAPLT